MKFEGSLENATILLVEDDVSLQGLLRKYLDRYQGRVLSANDGERAWALFQEHSVDLIISDWMMPLMDGKELLRRVKSTRRGESVPFLFLTARDKIEDMVEGLGSGASEYMTKPFHLTELLARVHTLLRMKRLHDDLRREKTRLEEELSLAQRVQTALMAHSARIPPECLDVRVHYRPASFIGGDFFDVIELGEGRYGLFLGDVTGRGPAAALITSLVKGFLGRLAPGIHAPSRVLVALNDHLVDVLEPQMYISCFYAIFHVGGRTLRFANGGQNRQVLLAGERREPRPLYIDGTLVGLFRGQSYVEQELRLSRGDRIVFYTDGVYEQAGHRGEVAGYDWVAGIAAVHAFDPLERLLGALVEAPANPGVEAGTAPRDADDLLVAAVEVK